MSDAPTRVIVWFSCGAASAVAAKLAVKKYDDRVEVVYCNTLASEHQDNERFLRDVERWTGKKVTIISSEKYASIDEVFEKTRYMSGISGARCTVEMKKLPRLKFQQPDDLHIFGLTADEGTRITRFTGDHPDLDLEWNLQDAGLEKDDCLRMIVEANIVLPAMYALGYKNNNCIGCVKATSAKYWDKVRRDFPEVFARRAKQSRDLGVRLTRFKGERIFLDDLPTEGIRGQLENISCGPDCVDGSMGSAPLNPPASAPEGETT